MIVYTLKQNEDEQWSIYCMGSALASRLLLGPAIKQARSVAHIEHMDSGLPTCVELHGAGPVVRLAQYDKPETRWRTAAA